MPNDNLPPHIQRIFAEGGAFQQDNEPRPSPLNPDIEVEKLTGLHDLLAARTAFKVRDVIRLKPGLGNVCPMIGHGFAVVMEVQPALFPLDPQRPLLNLVDLRIAGYDEDGDATIGYVDARYFELVTPAIVADLLARRS